MIALGICTGYFVCYGSVKISSSLSWRLPFALQALVALIFTVSVLLFSPQSPRWLTGCGRHEEALAVWEKLGIGAAEREKSEGNADSTVPEPVRMKDLLAVFGKDVWRQTALRAFLMGMQQLSGIDGVLYRSQGPD
jgi:MFS family permease